MSFTQADFTWAAQHKPFEIYARWGNAILSDQRMFDLYLGRGAEQMSSAQAQLQAGNELLIRSRIDAGRVAAEFDASAKYASLAEQQARLIGRMRAQNDALRSAASDKLLGGPLILIVVIGVVLVAIASVKKPSQSAPLVGQANVRASAV